MAGNLLVSEETSLPKTVQEMSMNSDEPAPQFLVKETSFGSQDSTISVPIPIIDVSLLSSEDELEKLRSSLSSAGCFQVRTYNS